MSHTAVSGPSENDRSTFQNKHFGLTSEDEPPEREQEDKTEQGCQDYACKSSDKMRKSKLGTAKVNICHIHNLKNQGIQCGAQYSS